MTIPKHGTDCGQNDLVAVYIDGTDSEANTVRWCPRCGAVVIDLDYDGRTNAGQVMKMRVPTYK